MTQYTCSLVALLLIPVDRELAVGGGCEAAALSCSRTLFGVGRILGGLVLCACALGQCLDRVINGISARCDNGAKKN
jgi:hypothetical protein